MHKAAMMLSKGMNGHRKLIGAIACVSSVASLVILRLQLSDICQLAKAACQLADT